MRRSLSIFTVADKILIFIVIAFLAVALNQPVLAGDAIETRTFRNPKIKGYRLDWCRFWGLQCGKEAAHAFCRFKGYLRAKSWEIDCGPNVFPTYVIETGQICNRAGCCGFKYIECEPITSRKWGTEQIGKLNKQRKEIDKELEKLENEKKRLIKKHQDAAEQYLKLSIEEGKLLTEYYKRLEDAGKKIFKSDTIVDELKSQIRKLKVIWKKQAALTKKLQEPANRLKLKRIFSEVDKKKSKKWKINQEIEQIKKSLEQLKNTEGSNKKDGG